MSWLKGWLNGLWTAALSGAVGGALVGLGEATLVVLTSGAAEEYWLFLFGVVAYGLLGAVIGVGCGALWLLIRRGASEAGRVAQIAVALGLGLPAFAVGRYHVGQRVFQEGLVLASPVGVATHLGLVLGAAALAVVAGLGLRALYRQAGNFGSVGLLAAACLLAVGIGLSTGSSPASTAQRRISAGVEGRPNIILIVADTLRADAIEPYGATAGSTPAFARLAADGVVFERAYAQASWTRPSIASILTAQYPSEHGSVHKMDFLSDGAFTLAEALRAEGYWTGGVVTNINVAPVFNFQQGFDEYVYLEPDFYFGASDSATKLAVYKGLRMARERFLSTRMYFNNYYQDAEVLGRRAAEWLESSPPQPFFLLLHYMDPHDPYFAIPYDGRGVARVMTPSPPAEEAAELHRLYTEDVVYLDQHLDVLLDRLRRLGLYEDSVIAMVSDHGEEFYEHGDWWHGTTLYEEALHVPLIVKRGRESLPGQRKAGLVQLIDLAPTIMGAAGLRLPASFTGVDRFASEPAQFIFAEEELEGNQLAALRVGDWKLITANRDNPRGLQPLELYNLRADPGERVNLAGQERERVASLLARMRELRREIAAGEAGTAREARNHDVADPRS